MPITYPQLLAMAQSIAVAYSAKTPVEKALLLVGPYLTWTEEMMDERLPYAVYNLGQITVNKEEFIRFVLRVQQEIAKIPG